MMLLRPLFIASISLLIFSCGKKPIYDCSKNNSIEWTDIQPIIENDSTLLFVDHVYFGSPEAIIQSESLKRHLLLRKKTKKKDASWKNLLGYDPYIGDNQFNILFVEKLNGCFENFNGSDYAYFKRMFRLLGDAFVLLEQQGNWDEELRGLQEGSLQPQFDLKDYFRPRFQGNLELYHFNDSLAFSGPDALAFWIWRHGDETKSLCWSTFQKILSDYDEDWCLQHPGYCN